MSQRVIACEVVGEYVTGDGVVVGAAGSHDEVIIELDFSRAGETWEGTTKTVTFTDALGLNPTNVLLTANLLVEGRADAYNVPIPHIVKAIAGKMGMTVAGVVVSGDTEVLRVATEVSPFRILPANMLVWEGDEDIPASSLEQIQAELDAILTQITGISESVTAAANSASEAAGSAITASNAAQGILDMSVSAETLLPGQDATVTKSVHNNVVNLEFGIPSGAVYDENSGIPIRFWFGTLEEYNELEEIEPDVYYNIEMEDWS